MWTNFEVLRSVYRRIDALLGAAAHAGEDAPMVHHTRPSADAPLLQAALTEWVDQTLVRRGLFRRVGEARGWADVEHEAVQCVKKVQTAGFATLHAVAAAAREGTLNAALKAGTRQGEKAPSKCKSCHTKK